MNNLSDSGEPLILRLERSYLCLHRHYRLGGFERSVPFLYKWRPDETRTDTEFYELCDDQETAKQGKPKAGDISFREAINDLYRLSSYIERERPEIAAVEGVLLLRCKCLIYEATDYMLDVPAALGSYFIDMAENFPNRTREVERQAEALNGGTFANKDEQAKVIKLLLIAVLCGANELYRQHNGNSYGYALQILERLNRFVIEELPRQHEEERQSFGLLGLAQYVTGRILSRKGAITESRRAFRQSAEAYVARLRQKEEFYRDKTITLQQYEEKISVTVRRAALVTAFGEGYHSFVSSQLTRALETLTLARAALTRNSGRVYLTYVDLLYWACQRAAQSSSPTAIEECVRELRKCRATFRELVRDSHYPHRAGIQLALALFYRAKLSGSNAVQDYDEGMSYLVEAIRYAEQVVTGKLKNPHLLASALVSRSRFLSSRYRWDKKSTDRARSHQHLIEAEADASRALEVSDGISEIQSEALATLGDVYTDLAELYKKCRDDEFHTYFNKGLAAFRSALEENRGENVRIDAVCFLRLTKLCLLNPHTEVLAHEYFAQWKEIESKVEHQYCQTMASELEGKLGGSFFLVKATDPLNYKDWEKKLSRFLLDQALKRFVARHAGKNYKVEKLGTLLVNHLCIELGYGATKVSKLIKDQDLETRVMKMREESPEAFAKSKRLGKSREVSRSD